MTRWVQLAAGGQAPPEAPARGGEIFGGTLDLFSEHEIARRSLEIAEDR